MNPNNILNYNYIKNPYYSIHHNFLSLMNYTLNILKDILNIPLVANPSNTLPSTKDYNQVPIYYYLNNLKKLSKI